MSQPQDDPSEPIFEGRPATERQPALSASEAFENAIARLDEDHEDRTPIPPADLVGGDAKPAARLRGLSGEWEGQDVEINEALLVGRAKDCQLVLSDPAASRVHCLITFDSQNLTVTDRSSQNGTWVNGARIDRCALRDGDILRIGANRFQVRVDERGRGAAGVNWINDPLGGDFTKTVIPSLKQSTEGTSFEQIFTAMGFSDPSVDADLGQLRRRNNLLAVLLQVSHLAHSTSNTEAMLSRVMDLLMDAVVAERGVLALLDNKEELQPRIVKDPYRDSDPSAPVPMSRSVCERVIRERVGILSNNPHDRFFNADSIVFSPVRSIMSVPILSGERVLGVLELSSITPGQHFDEMDLATLGIIAGILGGAITSRALQKELEKKVADLKIARDHLISAHNELVRQEQNITLGALARHILHEVRNHVQPIIANAETMVEQYPEGPEYPVMLGEMKEMAATIEDELNEYKRVAADAQTGGETIGEDQSSLLDTDLGTIVASALRIVGKDKEFSGIQLRSRLVESPTVAADSRRLRACLVNLIRNGAYAAEQRQSVTGKAKVEVRVFPEADSVCVEVRDNGEGMGLDRAERLLRRAFQSTKGRRGMGIGLEICKNVVQAHRGVLEFESWPDRGTTVRIRLPRTSLHSDNS
jgi:signal transduction histidine kinase